jgi:phosphoglycolate phosphatase
VSAVAPGADPVATAAAYRSLYAEHGVRRTTLMPAALGALQAVRDLGGRVLIVSAKAPVAVLEVLHHVGLGSGDHAPDVVVGGLFAAAKGERLGHEHADVYVGDHTADVEAARVAGAVAVAVATGPVPAAELAAAGADVVLPDLGGFAEWLPGYWGHGGSSHPEITVAGTRGARAGGQSG